MRRRAFSASWLFILIWSTASISAAEPTASTASDKPDAERILGKWILKESDRPNPIFMGDGADTELNFEDGKFEFAVLKDGGRILHIPGTYFIDDKQTPKLLDVTLGGDGGSNSVFAIYEFKSDRLRIRIRDDNGQRPADFETQEADCQILTFARPETK